MKESVFPRINLEEFVETSNSLMMSIRQEIKKNDVSITLKELGFSDSDLPCQKNFKFEITSKNGSGNKILFEINAVNIEIINFSFSPTIGWIETGCKIVKNHQPEVLEEYFPEIIKFLKS